MQKRHPAMYTPVGKQKVFIDKMAAGNWNDYYDGLTIHPYCGDPGADQDKGAFYDSAMRLAENVGIQKVKIM